MEGILAEYYGLSGCHFKKLVGYISTNYRIKSDQGTYLLKVYKDSPEDKEQILAEIEMIRCLDHLDAQSVSTVIPNTKGEFITIMDGKIYRLMSFVEGLFLKEVEPTPKIYTSLGRFMGKMDVKLKGFRSSPIEARKLDWDLQYFQRVHPLTKYVENPEDRKLIEHFILQWDQHVYPRLEQLRKSIIHNDGNDWNVLIRDGEVKGVIDFGDAVHTPLINELGITMAYALFDKEEPLEWAAHIIDGYHSAYPLLEEELDLLYYIVAGRLVTSLCFSSYDKTLQPDNDYITVSQRPALALLRQWLAIGPVKAKNTFYKAAGFPVEMPPSEEEVLKKRYQVVSPILSVSYKQPIHMASAAFQYMYDAHGNSFLDAYNNIPHVGHQHPKVVASGQRQMATLNTNTRYLYDQLEAYAAQLLAKFPSPLNKVYFVNSGSAASDLAVRLAQNFTGHKAMMVMEHGYHGNTRMGIDISHYKYTSRGGKGQPTHIIEAPIPGTYRGEFKGEGAGAKYAAQAIERLKASGNPVAGLIAEPIVGCGGQVPLAPGYLQAMYPAIRAQGGLCISDEVQTGFGRMGSHFWGFEMNAVVPDIVVLGKPMGNGHPMGAIVTTDAIAEAFDNGMEFFSSFGGNPVSCAIGSAVLDVIEEEKLQENSLATGNYFMESVKTLQSEFSCIGDVRGSGLFIGIEFIKDENLTPDTELAALIKNELRSRHILVSTDGPYDSVIKSKPPLCFTKANVDQVVEEMRDVFVSAKRSDLPT
ncbi:MAG: aminotransferase class III-fold pyridoxal phosphate-dependent enzyme [Roseivirga sp.]|nr:aminotransferase class III-fold pyridoxal phosphate-dependent enzyme [Roseivirga sp.]